MPYDPPHQQMGRSVGAKLKEARLAKKYTQSQLAGTRLSEGRYIPHYEH